MRHRIPNLWALALVFFLLSLSLSSVLAAPPPVAKPARPRLVLLLVMDQFRQDFLVRHRDSFVPGGFRLLLERGAVFANCNYPYASTVTAVGHTVIGSGSYPPANGIVGNDWYDPVEKKVVTAEGDSSVKLLGGAADAPGASPHRMIGSTLADELRLVTNGRSRVVGISVKARAAVLPAGKSANAAYWFDTKTLNALSSTYYMKDLPAWVKQFNARDLVVQYAGKEWRPVDNPKGEAFEVLPPASHSAAVGSAVHDSPFITEIEFAFAEQAIEQEKLGQGLATDFLSISISATDLVGHIYGPDAAETRDTILRADRDIAQLLRFLDARIGLANVWIGFSADHGVAPRAEVANEFGQSAGRIADKAITDKVNQAIAKAYPPAAGAPADNWVQAYTFPSLYLNRDLIRSRGLQQEEVARRAAAAVLELPAFAAAFTAADLAGCRPSPELIGKVCAGYFPPRAGDVFLVFKPYWIYEMKDHPQGAGHGTPYSYDTHVPLILEGAPFKAGTYYTPATPADLAVTLAAALGVDSPPLASGRVLSEALAAPAAPAARANPAGASTTR